MSNEESPAPLRDKLAWLPVALLVGVALTHVYRVEVFDLTPWKGGGFGMFSTLDGRDSRRLFVLLVRQSEGKKQGVDVDLPRKGTLKRLADKARAMPTAENLKALALEVAKHPWRIADRPQRDGANQARLILEPTKQAHTRLVGFDEVVVNLVK
jgi:hypothetical protein